MQEFLAGLRQRQRRADKLRFGGIPQQLRVLLA